MISLRKHIDSFQDPMAESSLAAYRSVLLAIADCGERAVPGIGCQLNHKLTELHNELGQPVTPETLALTGQTVERELAAWAHTASGYHSDNVREIREIIQVVTNTGQSVVSRDERYARQIGDLNGRLKALADLNDLPVIRRSILESTRELKSCVEKMADESRESVKALIGEVAQYRQRLEESERQSETDLLTQLTNRRGLERQIALKMSAKQNFCLMMADLNDFKGVNDQYGHPAGDDLLRQFAGELRGQCRPGDVIGRWGGDEFIGVISAGRLEADACVERIRKWVLGDYKIKVSDKPVKIAVDASIGLVQWTGGESAEQLMQRVDAAAYAAKPSKRGFPGGSRRESDRAGAKQ